MLGDSSQIVAAHTDEHVDAPLQIVVIDGLGSGLSTDLRHVPEKDGRGRAVTTRLRKVSLDREGRLLQSQ